MKKAKLPGLPKVATGNVALDQWIRAVSETIEVREGARGSPSDQVVTKGDLKEVDLSGLVTRSGLSDAMRNTQTFSELLSRVSTSPAGTDPTVARLAAEVSISEQRVVNSVRAYAELITAVRARLDNFAGGVAGEASVEEKMTALADTTTGLEAQYTLKVTAGNKVAGIGLASTSNTAGVGTSAVIISADKFALAGPNEVIVDPANPPVDRLPFGYDSTTNTIYINGQLRVNAGGMALEDAAAGAPGEDAQLLTLSPTGYAFVYDSPTATSSTSPTIAFTAALQNVTGTAVFTATAYNAAGTSLGAITLGGSGNTRTLTAAQFNSLGATTTRYVKVDATLGGLTDTTTIYRGDSGADGADAITAILSNEAHVVPASNTGVVSSFTGATSIIKVFEGVTDVTSLWTFTAAVSSVGGTFNGSALPVTTGFSGVASPSVVVTSLSANVGTVTITATRSGYPTQTKVFSLSKSLAGAQGDTGTGSTGARGTVSGVRVGGANWSDYYANGVVYDIVNGIAIGTTSTSETGHLRIGDHVTLSFSNAPYTTTKYWTGSSWLAVALAVDGNAIVSGTLAASKISAGTITAAVSLSTGGYVQADGSTASIKLTGHTASGLFNESQARSLGVVGIASASLGGGGVVGYGTNTGYGVWAYAGGSQKALYATGSAEVSANLTVANLNVTTSFGAPITTSSTNQCTGLNANYLQGKLATAFSLTSHTHSGYATTTTSASVNGVTTGTRTAAFPGNNKPGTTSGANNIWLEIVAGGTTYWVPAWAN